MVLHRRSVLQSSASSNAIAAFARPFTTPPSSIIISTSVITKMVQTRSGAGTRHSHNLTAMQSGKGFLGLAREIRDQVYQEVLVSDKHIEVFCNMDQPPTDDLLKTCKQVGERAIRDLCGINTSLLMVCRTITEEACGTFYGKNTFAFVGTHDYKDEVDWLLAIGPKNNSYLTSIYIDVREPSLAWQLEDGTREGMEDDAFDTRHARHPLLQKPQGTWLEEYAPEWQEGPVTDIDPDIEGIFALLGQPLLTDAASVHVQLVNFTYDSLPGVPHDLDCCGQCAPAYYSTDLPNLVEAWRTDYGSRRPIEVTWIDIVKQSKADYILGRYLAADWILKERQDGEASATLLLKRNPNNEPIIADQPSGHINTTGGGRPAENLADEPEYGLYLCAKKRVHKVGKECDCDEGYLSTSLAPTQPTWPAMPSY